MADVIHTDNSGTGIVIGILVALVVAIGAYFVIADRDAAGPDINVNMPSASAPAAAPDVAPAAGTAQ